MSEEKNDNMNENKLNIFGFVKEFLDEILNDVKEDNDEKKYEKISDACSELYNVYKGKPLMEKNREDIDYDNPKIRFAYVYRNTPLHSIILFNIISTVNTLSSLMKQDSLTVTCLGGGPGSDVFGLLLYRYKNKIKEKFSCALYDKALWQNCWVNLVNCLPVYDLTANIVFMMFDATQHENPCKIPKCQLIIMQYFVSEMYKYREKFSKYFKSIASTFQKDTLVLIVEMNWFQFLEWINEVMSYAGLESIEKWKFIDVDAGGYDETLKKLGSHYTQLSKINPKNKPRTFAENVRYALWKKK